MYCTKCGKKNADDRLFCGFCGSPLEAPGQGGAGREDAERRLYGRPEAEAVPAEAVETPAGTAEAPKPGPALSRRARRERQAEAAIRETAAREEDGQPDGDIEPPIPQRAPAKPVPAVAEGRACAQAVDVPRGGPDEAGGEEDGPDAGALDDAYGAPVDIPPEGEQADDGAVVEDPLARPLLHKPVELRAKRPPQLSRTSPPVKSRAATGTRRASTVVPPRVPDTDDLFFEDETEAEDDIADFVQEYLDDYCYEERPSGNFFMRHIRGFVCLILLLIFSLVVGYWLRFGDGQRVLGQLYISRNPETYIALAEEASAAGDNEEAGAYYLKALELKGDGFGDGDFEIAVNAANAYSNTGDTGHWAEALEYIIAIDPDYHEAYTVLRMLYPDPAARPQDVTQLLQQGYQNTGDASLIQ